MVAVMNKSLVYGHMPVVMMEIDKVYIRREGVGDVQGVVSGDQLYGVLLLEVEGLHLHLHQHHLVVRHLPVVAPDVASTIPQSPSVAMVDFNLN